MAKSLKDQIAVCSEEFGNRSKTPVSERDTLAMKDFSRGLGTLAKGAVGFKALSGMPKLGEKLFGDMFEGR